MHFKDNISKLVIWTMVEGYVVLIAACIPTLHPVYDRFTGRSKNTNRTYPCRPPNNDHKISNSKQSFWSARKLSFGYFNTGSAGCSSRRWSVNGSGIRGASGGGGGRNTVSSMADMASPRTLEDAANLAYPPAAIWKQTVRVGQHSRIRSQDHDSF